MHRQVLVVFVYLHSPDAEGVGSAQIPVQGFQGHAVSDRGLVRAIEGEPIHVEFFIAPPENQVDALPPFGDLVEAAADGPPLVHASGSVHRYPSEHGSGIAILPDLDLASAILYARDLRPEPDSPRFAEIHIVEYDVRVVLDARYA